MKYNSSSQSGFSLVETLVAITILLIVIIGPMTISATAARSTSFSSEQVIAFFLAQEGAEIAHKTRDDYILANFSDPNTGWDSFTDATSFGVYEDCFKPTGCGLELNTNDRATLKSVKDCALGCVLYSNSASGDRSRYTYTSTGNAVTPYTRTIQFQEVNPHEIKVISKVSWRTGSQKAAQEVSVETYLFNVYGS